MGLRFHYFEKSVPRVSLDQPSLLVSLFTTTFTFLDVSALMQIELGGTIQLKIPSLCLSIPVGLGVVGLQMCNSIVESSRGRMNESTERWSTRLAMYSNIIKLINHIHELEIDYSIS